MINKQNLAIAADFLEQNVSEEQFHMGMFMKNGRIQHLCGTVGCAIGWASFCPELLPVDSEFMRLTGRLDFDTYCERVFGFNDDDCIWNFLFGAEWETIDNTVKGAVARIRWIVNGGNIVDLHGYYNDSSNLEPYYEPYEEDVYDYMGTSNELAY